MATKQIKDLPQNNSLVDTDKIPTQNIAGTTQYALFSLIKSTLKTYFDALYTLVNLGGVAANGAISGATKTKITYDAKGLVTSGTDATTADIADSNNKRYCLETEKTILGSGLALVIPDWATSTLYLVGYIIKRNTTIYMCNTQHTSGTFYTDWLSNLYWTPLADWPGCVQLAGGIAPAGHILVDDTHSTVGDSSSGAHFAGDIYRELYEYIGANFGGTKNWAAHNTINLMDFRGVFPKGAGTTNRASGKDANGNYYAGTLGTYLTDKMQGHRHPLINDGTPITSWDSGRDGGVEVVLSSGNAIKAYTQYIGNPITDGTNGTPRTGLTTEPQSLGISFIIKY